RDGSPESKIMAVDLATGKPRWEKKRLSPVSYGTPVVWDTAGGKQVVAPGHGRLTAYDLKSGQERWFVAGMPSGCCTSPVAAEGLLFFAGWSPGQEAEFKMPTFDEILKQAGEEKLGYLTREGSEKTFFKGFFDHQDTNMDGKITRDE